MGSKGLLPSPPLPSQQMLGAELPVLFSHGPKVGALPPLLYWETGAKPRTPDIGSQSLGVSTDTENTRSPSKATHSHSHSQYGSESPQVHRLKPKAQGVSTRPTLILEQRQYKMRRPSSLPLCCLRARGSLTPSHMFMWEVSPPPYPPGSIALSRAVNKGPCPPPACGGLDTRFRLIVLRFYTK